MANGHMHSNEGRDVVQKTPKRQLFFSPRITGGHGNVQKCVEANTHDYMGE